MTFSMRARLAVLMLCSFSFALSSSAQTPIIKVADADSAKVFLEHLDVKVQVIGSIATTTWAMTFRNNTARLLEGELTFPLGEGITISRYAIDINGKLREAVPVDKARGTTVLEAIENRRVDPGLLERVEGNSFRTRIYPLPANGIRTVVIAYEEELKRATSAEGALRYTLALLPRKAIPQLSVEVSVLQSKSRPEFASNTGDVAFDTQGSNWVAKKSFTNYSSTKPLSFSIPAPENGVVQVLMQPSGNHFYFIANTAGLRGTRSRPAPDSVTILWDASLSARFRNRERELALLDAYFHQLKDAVVDLVVFRNTVQATQTFVVNGGNWKALRKELESIEPDGGTQLGLINPATLRGKEILLFSDGISTYGKSDVTPGRKPFYCIVSSPASDFPALKYLAQASGGSLINLASNVDLGIAGKELFAQPIRFIGVKPAKDIEDAYPAVPVSAANGVTIAGITYAPQGEIVLQYGYGNTVTEERRISYNVKTQEVADAHLDRIWASKKIADLDLRYEANRATIESLGKRYGLITRNTSLIVLESVSDYLRYGIEPPAELRDEYDRAIKLQGDQRVTSVQNRLQIAENSFNELQQWWNSSYEPKKVAKGNGTVQFTPPVVVGDAEVQRPTGRRRVPSTARHMILPEPTQGYTNFRRSRGDQSGIGGGRISRNAVVGNGTQTGASMAAPPNAAPTSTSDEEHSAPFRGNTDGAYDRSINRDDDQTETQRIVPGHPAALNRSNSSLNGLANTYEWHADSMQVQDGGVENYVTDGAIKTRAFQFDTSIINQLASLPRDAQYSRYLKLREKNISNPSFYFQAAAYFTAQNQKSLGLRVLSNLAELEMENYEVTKMLGFKLKEEGEWEAAVSAFRKVVKWRPMDPQSYRDYGLALADAGHYQQALDTLNAALTGNIDESLEAADRGIEETIITEINNLIALHGTGLNTSAVSRKVLGAQPVDIRVVINWNMKNTDIDLWVTDPNDEKCFYSHKETEMGGRISSDITQGLGPEQFMLRKAAPGKYKVEVNYYGDRQIKIAGPTTVMAEIYTAYGTPQQKRQVIVLQMVGREKGGVYLGTFDFKR